MLIQRNAPLVMVGAGLLMVAVVALAALSPSVWRLGDDQPVRAGGGVQALRPGTPSGLNPLEGPVPADLAA